MAQGYLLQEQLRQSQLAGEPIKEWGKFGENVIKSVVGYHKGKLLTDIEARRAEQERYEKATKQALTDRSRTEKIGEFMDAARTGKYITFEKGDRVTYDIDSVERAEDLARKLGIRQDERVKPFFSKEYRYVPSRKYKYNPRQLPSYPMLGPVSERRYPIMGKIGKGTEVNFPVRPLIRGGFIKVGTPAKKSSEETTLKRPADVSRSDWNAATDETKRALINR